MYSTKHFDFDKLTVPRASGRLGEWSEPIDGVGGLSALGDVGRRGADGVVERHAGLRGDGLQHLAVVVRERPAPLVDHLDHARQRAVGVVDGHGQDGVGAVARLPVDVRVEPRVRVGVAARRRAPWGIGRLY